jgi:uncharacterized protein (DUF2141 family)
MEEILSDEQHAFHWERSMTDLTLTLRSLTEKLGNVMVLVFTEFEKQMAL